MAQAAENLPIEMKHGHSNTHIVIVFSRPTDNLQVTPEQLEAMIAAMRQSAEKLAAHRKNLKLN